MAIMQFLTPPETCLCSSLPSSSGGRILRIWTVEPGRPYLIMPWHSFHFQTNFKETQSRHPLHGGERQIYKIERDTRGHQGRISHLSPPLSTFICSQKQLCLIQASSLSIPCLNSTSAPRRTYPISAEKPSSSPAGRPAWVTKPPSPLPLTTQLTSSSPAARSLQPTNSWRKYRRHIRR